LRTPKDVKKIQGSARQPPRSWVPPDGDSTGDIFPTMAGRVEAIFTAAAEALPVQRRTRVMARPGIGLDGDRHATGNGYWSGDRRVGRDLTLIEAEAIEDVAAKLGVDLELGVMRRNIVTRGVRLNDLVGTRFWVGAATPPSA
jgi:hypothetical protein